MKIRLLEGSQVKLKRAMAPIQQHTCARWHTGTHPNSVHTEDWNIHPLLVPQLLEDFVHECIRGKEDLPHPDIPGGISGDPTLHWHNSHSPPHWAGKQGSGGLPQGEVPWEHRLCWLLLTLCIQGVFGESKAFATEDHLNKMPVKHNNSLWSWARERDSLQNKF